MYDSGLHDPSLLGGGSADRWRTDLRFLVLEAELAATRHELEVLRETSAQLLTAILAQMHKANSPAIAAPPEICELAGLSDASPVTDEDPITSEMPELALGRDTSLARLDRRFRWLPARSK